MPVFDYQCENCGKIKEHFLKEAVPAVACDCGKMAKRLFTLGRMAPPETPIWSKSMGVSPEQIPEMNKVYPHHEYHKGTGDLRVRNAKHRDKLAHELGMTVLS